MKVHRALILTVLTITTSLHLAAAVYNIGGQKQLFIDHRFIEHDAGITLQANPPIKMGLVLSGVESWEDGVVYGPATTILEDNGKFRMWYIATAAAKRPVDGNRSIATTIPWTTNGLGRIHLCYAESTDGIHWVKPSLGIYNWKGSTNNNILMDAVIELGAGVFMDPKAPAGQRYKMLGRLHEKGQRFNFGSAPNGPGMYLYTSPDGLKWRLNPTRLFPFSPDTTNMAFYDTRSNKYLIYLRTWVNDKRRVGVIQTDDIMKPWPYRASPAASHHRFSPSPDETPPSTEIEDAFGVDNGDPPDVDHYFPSTVRYPWAADAYFMFPSAFRHFKSPDDGKPHNSDGVLDAQMAISRDGLTFHRISRLPYIELGPWGSPDCCRIYIAVGILRRRDELLQYYGGFDYTHGASIERYLEDSGSSIGERIDQPDFAELHHRGGIFLACQRLDGFVSADADDHEGQFETPPLTFLGSSLMLNMNASATGNVLVELRHADGKPIPAYSFADCDPLFENDTSKVVTWRGGNPDVTRLVNRTVRIGFRLRAAKLYSFQFIE